MIAAEYDRPRVTHDLDRLDLVRLDREQDERHVELARDDELHEVLDRAVLAQCGRRMRPAHELAQRSREERLRDALEGADPQRGCGVLRVAQVDARGTET